MERRDILAVALVLKDPRSSSAACLLASKYGMAPRNHSPKHEFCQAFLSGRIRVSVQSVLGCWCWVFCRDVTDRTKKIVLSPRGGGKNRKTSFPPV